jgi:Ca2+-binding EF-hand superfamily protein
MALQEAQLQLKRRVHETSVVFEHREGSRMVAIRDIPAIVRSLGYNPSEEQLQALMQVLAPPEDANMLPIEAFDGPVAQWLLEQQQQLSRDSYFLLLRAFQALDPDKKGYLTADQVTAALGTTNMTQDEVNAMILAAADDQGRIHYAEYAYHLATDGRTI